MKLARLLDERDGVKFTPEKLAATRRELRRNVLVMWQTSIVRGTRLRVIDEVANGLSYYDYTFLHALPTFYADLEDRLASAEPALRGVGIPSFLYICSWVSSGRGSHSLVNRPVTSPS